MKIFQKNNPVNFAKTNRLTENLNYNSLLNSKKKFNYYKNHIDSFFNEYKGNNIKESNNINIFNSYTNLDFQNPIKNKIFYTPISKKSKNYSIYNFSSTNSNSKIESKIKNLKREIGIQTLKKNYSISFSEKINKKLKHNDELINENILLKEFFEKFNYSKSNIFKKNYSSEKDEHKNKLHF